VSYPAGFTLFTAARDDDDRRLDRLVRRLLPDLPLSAVYRAIRSGAVRLNGRKAGGEDRVKAGDTVAVLAGLADSGSAAGGKPDRPETAESSVPAGPGARSAAAPPVDVIHEDDRLLFVNKSAGFRVHGKGSLGDAVSAYLAPSLNPSLSFRPGPLHRLDTNTSGVLCFSRSLEGARFFSTLIAEGRLVKEYLAVVEGRFESPELWEDEIVRDRVLGVSRAAGEPEKRGDGQGSSPEALPRTGDDAPSLASAEARPLAVSAGASLLLVTIKTGRTHQIRVQASIHGHPLLGDRKYGSSRTPPAASSAPYLLHAAVLRFREEDRYPGLPAEIRARVPDYFLRSVEIMFGSSALESIGSS
jgi:23S rRNA pseudouridine955/2504/2580 synthase